MCLYQARRAQDVAVCKTFRTEDPERRVSGGRGNVRIDVDDGDPDDVVNFGKDDRDRVEFDRGDSIRKNCERR